MASKYINPNIDYGNPTDVRMNNGTSVIPLPPVIPAPIDMDESERISPKEIAAILRRDAAQKAAEIRKAACPKGSYYQGMADGVPKCKTLDGNIKYRDKDKQAAYDKAKAEGTEWTGQYTKDELTGEVIPKTLEDLTNEAKGIVAQPNLLKKYWWVLAAAGVLIILSND